VIEGQEAWYARPLQATCSAFVFYSLLHAHCIQSVLLGPYSLSLNESMRSWFFIGHFWLESYALKWFSSQCSEQMLLQPEKYTYKNNTFTAVFLKKGQGLSTSSSSQPWQNLNDPSVFICMNNNFIFYVCKLIRLCKRFFISFLQKRGCTS